MVFEIGDQGVARLCESSVALALVGAPAAWAEDYLLRAGMSVTRATGDGGPPEAALLGPATAALRGTLEAVEIIKRTLGVGTSGCVEDAMREASRRE
jgi:hypothetical protein